MVSWFYMTKLPSGKKMYYTALMGLASTCPRAKRDSHPSLQRTSERRLRDNARNNSADKVDKTASLLSDPMHQEMAFFPCKLALPYKPFCALQKQSQTMQQEIIAKPKEYLKKEGAPSFLQSIQWKKKES
jgi:hypothetical protein